MKKAIVPMLVLCSAMCLSSCGGASENESNSLVVENPELDKFKVYELDTTAQRVKFADMIERVELMRLEETDASLLSYVSEVVETDDYYLLNSGKAGDILFFSKEGLYQSKINRQGEGPEEYKRVGDKWVNGDTLFVYSSTQQEIKGYLRNGTFVKGEDVPFAASQVFPYSDGYALDMNMEFINDSLGYNVVLLDKNLTPEKFDLAFKGERPFGVSTEFNGFRKYGDDLVYFRATSDTLYLLKDQEMVPLAKFDFGRSWLWNDENVVSDPENIINAMQSSKSFWNMGVRANKRWYYLNFMRTFRNIDGLMINRATDEYRIIDFRVSQDEKYVMNALAWQGDRLMFSISSVNVADLLSELEESQWQFRKGTTLEAIESSENPVVMWVKFKDGFE